MSARRRLAPLFALLLAACRSASIAGPSTPPAPAVAAERPTPDLHRRRPNREERALVDALMRETEKLRALPFRQPVEVTIEDRVAMRAYVERAIDDEQLARARQRYLALGVLDPALDIRGTLVALMDEELIGYYDPKEKRLAVRDDIARALERDEPRRDRTLMWRATVVHELVHALQDQHFDLGARIDERRTTDADNAFGALVEGDATLAMLAYTAQVAGEPVASLTDDPERVRELMTRAPDQLTGALRAAPALIREPLLFRYRDGAAYCAALFRTGGFRAIDRAHGRPPESSRAIRFPGKPREASIALPELGWLASAGYVVSDQDVLGALELSVVLANPPEQATRTMEAWRGDHYAVVERSGHVGSLWWIRLANERAARELVSAFARLADRARFVARRRELVIAGYGVDRAVFERATSLAPRVASTPARRAQRAQSRPFGKADHPLARAAHEH